MCSNPVRARPLLVLLPRFGDEDKASKQRVLIEVVVEKDRDDLERVSENEIVEHVQRQMLVGFDHYPPIRIRKGRVTGDVEYFDLTIDNGIIQTEWDLKDGGLLGGKGGFGAGLRAMGKTAAAKQNPSNDFSLCRDLSGNRLGAINTTLLLEKAKAAAAATTGSASGAGGKSSSDAGKVEADEWLLDRPTWVEGSGEGGSSKETKRHRKHQTNQEFTKKESRPKVDQAASFHVDFADHLQDTGEDTVSAVAEALSRKRSKMAQNSSSSANVNDDEDSENRTLGDTDTKSSPIPEAVKIISGKATVSQLNHAGETHKFRITGASEFCTVAFPTFSSKYYFDMVLLTDGLVQAGFADLKCLSSEMETNLDGIGDVDGSWGFDWTRQMVWSSGQPSKVDFGTILSTIESPVLLTGSFQEHERRISFSVQGNDSIASLVIDRADNVSIVPAVSLERGETIEIRLEPKSSKGERQQESVKETPATIESLEALGADKLKVELKKLGLKFGGTVQERAKRLLIARTLPKEEWPSSLFPS